MGRGNHPKNRNIPHPQETEAAKAACSSTEVKQTFKVQSDAKRVIGRGDRPKNRNIPHPRGTEAAKAAYSSTEVVDRSPRTHHTRGVRWDEGIIRKIGVSLIPREQRPQKWHVC